MKSRPRTVHVATGMDAFRIRRFCTTELGIPDEDVVFYVAQCLAFLLQGSDATLLSQRAAIARNKFAIRKLRSTLNMMNDVFVPPEE